jgi:hypothetical protein
VWFEGLDEFGCFVWRDDGLRAGGGGGKGGALLRERDVQLRLGGGGGGWGVVGGGGGYSRMTDYCPVGAVYLC